MNLGDLRKLVEDTKDMPNDTLILQQDPFSEFSFDITENFQKCRTRIDYTTDSGENFYESMTEESFKDFLNDCESEDEKRELYDEYKETLVL